MNFFSILVLTLLLVMLLAQLTLAWRQMRHVRAHRPRVPAAFAAKIPLTAHQKAADYTIAKTRLGMIEAVVGVALFLVWTFGGGLQGLDSQWSGAGLGPVATGVGFMLSVFLIMGVLDLPLSAYRTFVLETRFGFNKTTPALFISDLLKKIMLSLALGGPLIFMVLWLMQSAGALWWLYAWLLWTGFSLFMLWAYPAVIAPLFNKFRVLDRESMVRRIQALLARTGFTSRGVFVMDGSRRSAHGNAYFTGLGKNKRIVFFDTLLNALSEVEIEAVLAHELGHFKRRHVIKRMLLMVGMSLVGLAALGWLMQQPWFYTGLGVTQPSTHSALILFLLVVPVFTFFLHPLFAWSSRRHEFEADTFAAEQSDASALVSALVKLYEENASTLTPDSWHSAFYDSHPPAAVRIAHLEALA